MILAISFTSCLYKRRQQSFSEYLTQVTCSLNLLGFGVLRCRHRWHWLRSLKYYTESETNLLTISILSCKVLIVTLFSLLVVESVSGST